MRKCLIKIITGLFICTFAFVLSITKGLYSADKLLTDSFYQTPQSLNSKIKILAIDEKTIAELGDPSTWSREIPKNLVTMLDNEEEKPVIIAFDIMYVSPKDLVEDQEFAHAARLSGNVLTAVNIVYKDDLSLKENDLQVEKNVVKHVEFPYEELKNASRYGFANTYIDNDNSIRYTRLSVLYENTTINSLAYEAYKMYAEEKGIELNEPKNHNGYLGFKYQARHNDYEVISLCDVLSGKIDKRVFKDTVLFVGAYAPGLMDSYKTPIDSHTQLYGVEIHANIFEALLEGKTFLPVNNTLYAFITTLLVLVFYVAIINVKFIIKTIILVCLLAIYLIVAKVLFNAGIEIRIIEPILFFILIYVFHLGINYVYELTKKRKILTAFKKYVAPEVVEEIAKRGNFDIKLSSENKRIAVLFVDIRGFTTMSEGLSPSEVVNILNEYLSLTTQAIFKNRGTLDKFVGDATMAVFNAPFDQDDYIYMACKTALDIANGSNKLNQVLESKYHRSISYGIGINEGEAVVGNIGCENRMDYTAIGDTVNTAARLESNAKKGQILISEEVYNHVKDRVNVTAIGVIPLKGKSNDVFVYQLDSLKEDM